MPCNATAPSATTAAWRANSSKNRSSLGRKARNQRIMAASPQAEIIQHESEDPPRVLCHETVINGFGVKRSPCPGFRSHVIHRFMVKKKPLESRSLQRALQKMRELADEATPEQEHAGNEDTPLDHRHPLPEARKILLHGDDHKSPDHRPEHGAEPTDQRHQHN